MQNKALKSALIGILVLAGAMVAYYWYASRARTTENDVNFHERTEGPATETNSEITGIYASSEPVEGLEHRLGFFAIHRKEEGGFSGSAKMDRIATTVDSTIYVPCDSVTISEGEFFVKCSSPELGQISFTGQNQNGVVSGKVMWSKDGVVVADKSTTLQRSSAN